MLRLAMDTMCTSNPSRASVDAIDRNACFPPAKWLSWAVMTWTLNKTKRAVSRPGEAIVAGKHRACAGVQ